MQKMQVREAVEQRYSFACQWVDFEVSDRRTCLAGKPALIQRDGLRNCAVKLKWRYFM